MAIIPQGKKIYFASDFHLGVPNKLSSEKREAHIIKWLDLVKHDAAEIYLLGDLFDFWFEYSRVVPKGYIRFLGKLAELRDSGILIYAFIGNHDMWMFGYLTDELGIPVYNEPIEKEWNGKKFLIGHGDGLGPGDHGYKFIKKVFRNPICIFLFKWIHPDLGIKLAEYFSGTSRKANLEADGVFLGEEKEWLILFARETLKNTFYDYFIFGHRHLEMSYPLDEKSTYINLGSWFKKPHFAQFDGNQCQLISFPFSH